MCGRGMLDVRLGLVAIVGVALGYFIGHAEATLELRPIVELTMRAISTSNPTNRCQEVDPILFGYIYDMITDYDPTII